MSVILLTSSCKIKYKDVLDFPEMIELTLYIYYDNRLENSEKLQKTLKKLNDHLFAEITNAKRIQSLYSFFFFRNLQSIFINYELIAFTKII